MRLSQQFVARIADDLEEVVVDVEDGAVHAVLGDGLRLPDRFDLAAVIGVADRLRRDVYGVADDARDGAVGAADRCVERANPRGAPVHPDQLARGGHCFAVAKAGPERLVIFAVRVGWIHEMGVRTSEQVRQLVARRFPKDFVRIDDGAVRRDLDDRLHFGQRVDPRSCVECAQKRRTGLGDDLDDRRDPSLAVGGREEGREQGDCPAVFSGCLQMLYLRVAAERRRPCAPGGAFNLSARQLVVLRGCAMQVSLGIVLGGGAVVQCVERGLRRCPGTAEDFSQHDVFPPHGRPVSACR